MNQSWIYAHIISELVLDFPDWFRTAVCSPLRTGSGLPGLVQGQFRTRGGPTTMLVQEVFAKTVPDWCFWFSGLVVVWKASFRTIEAVSGLPGLVAGRVCLVVPLEASY